MLLNPKDYDPEHLDARSREVMRKTIAFFEAKGRMKLKADDRAHVWYQDFLDFVAGEQVFHTLLTPAAYGDGPEVRWDTRRNCDFNEITAFYGLHYWYTWQVSILGLGPIWMSGNEAVKRRTAQLLKQGGIFAFGLSEKEHGADIYATEMALAPQPGGGYLANGRKYYIGNGNKAALVSTLGKLTDSGEFVFFVVGSDHGRYECIRNVVNSQSFVSEYALNDCPIPEEAILVTGQEAWDTALNTVNVGKFNLGWASIGICTHAFYEAIDHAANRVLYGKHVTDFPHIRRLLTDAYCRLVAMRLFSQRASDYMRAASREDRRYLLYNPLVKMKVTTQGEEVVNLLWDVIAAKGFEKDTYFEMAARDIRALPKLEGTVHVNMALVVKFLQSYLFAPADLPEVPPMDAPANDDFLFAQGPARGLGKVRFHDYRLAYDAVETPNLAIFKEQTGALVAMLMAAPPAPEQTRDVDLVLELGELFTLVAYGQLIIERLGHLGMDADLLDQIFDFMVRDFSRHAVELMGKSSATEEQAELCLRMVRRPAADPARFERVWQGHVLAQKGCYRMND